MNGLIAREDPEVYQCSCKQRIKDCTFWNAIDTQMRERGFEFRIDHFDMGFTSGGPPLIQHLRNGSFRNGALDAMRDAIFQALPRERRKLKRLVARNEAFVDSVLTITGKQVFVDTSKDRLRLTALRKFSRFDVRAIHLVRDVRGVVASRLQRRRGVDAHEAARQWTKAHRDLQLTLGSWPAGKHIEVRYEDLCRDISGTMERIYRFCEVDPELRDTDFRSSLQHIIGNPMRLSNLSEIQPDERWRSQLTQEQLEEIQRVAGSLSRQYGYC